MSLNNNFGEQAHKYSGYLKTATEDIVKTLSNKSDLYYQIVEIQDLKIIAYIDNASMGELYSITNENFQHIIFAEVIKIEADNYISLLPLGETQGLSLVNLLVPAVKDYKFEVSYRMLGKVLNGFGEIIHEVAPEPDDLDPTSEFINLSVRSEIPNAFERQLINKQFVTGVKALDIMTPIGFGQRLVICAQPGVGKTTLIDMIAQAETMDLIIINLVGERGREVNEFISGLNKNVLSKVIIVLSTSDRPFSEQVKSIYTAHMIGSWFRGKGKNVLLLVDSITRFARALREVNLAAGANIIRSYTTGVFAAIPRILELAGNAGTGSITAFYTALFESESITNDPLVEEVKSVTDGHIILSRNVANIGRYPAINFLESISRISDRIVSPEHIQIIHNILNLYSRYKEYELLIKLGEYKIGSNADIDNIINKVAKLNEFFTQRSAEKYTETKVLLNNLKNLLAG